jgi:hypothetical protein
MQIEELALERFVSTNCNDLLPFLALGSCRARRIAMNDEQSTSEQPANPPGSTVTCEASAERVGSVIGPQYPTAEWTGTKKRWAA